MRERVVPLNLGFEPETGVPAPFLIQNEDDATLVFGAWRLEDRRVGVAVLEFTGCLIAKFGYPNDEALAGSPLERHGLVPYATQEVLDSSWVRSLEAQNRIAFPKSHAWERRHFVITLHDSTFECLATGLATSFAADPLPEVVERIVNVKAASDPPLVAAAIAAARRLLGRFGR